MRGKSNVIKRNVEKVWGARYTLGVCYLPKNTVIYQLLCHAPKKLKNSKLNKGSCLSKQSTQISKALKQQTFVCVDLYD
jgi:hypothetical protein